VILRNAQRVFGAIVGLGFAACRVDATLDDRPWPCDVGAAAEQCGELDGRPMTCWEGYCMPACEEGGAPSDPDKECLAGGVLVQRCDPTPGKPNVCSSGFNCHRTDLLGPHGVCVPFPLCSDKSDCRDRELNTCASEIIRDIAGENVPLWTNNLVCMATDCSRLGCSLENQRCLADVYPLEEYALPDVCVPLCDGSRHCPPNYTCANSTAAEGVHRICIPGLPGVRCDREQDCVFGSCVATGAGFNVCSTECYADTDCEYLNSAPKYFRCVPGPEGVKHCVHTAPFQGLFCDGDEDCTEHAPLCVEYSPFLPGERSECRPPCDDGRCPVRGGLAQVCLEDDTCYPGVFGMPCRSSSECLTPFACREVTLDGREYIESSAICTVPCDEDADCEFDPTRPRSLESQDLGYCDGSSCRARALGGRPCDRDGHCRSGVCDRGLCTMAPDEAENASTTRYAGSSP
jgi:hypothetical protein